MHSNSDVRFVVRRGPGVGGKVQLAIVLLAPRVSSLCLFPRRLTHLQHFSNPSSNIHEDISDIARQGLRRRDVVSRSPGLHQGPEPAVVHNLERPLTLGDPAYEFHTVECAFRDLFPSAETQLTGLLPWYVGGDCKSPFHFLCVEIPPQLTHLSYGRFLWTRERQPRPVRRQRHSQFAHPSSPSHVDACCWSTLRLPCQGIGGRIWIGRGSFRQRTQTRGPYGRQHIQSSVWV
jgi:hypothetical protein